VGDGCGAEDGRRDGSARDDRETGAEGEEDAEAGDGRGKSAMSHEWLIPQVMVWAERSESDRLRSRSRIAVHDRDGRSARTSRTNDAPRYHVSVRRRTETLPPERDHARFAGVDFGA
jgi:hypothetical protein